MSSIRIRKAVCWSHLDPFAGRVMSHRIYEKLHRRVALSRARGEPAVMLTLHYDRTPYGGSDDDDGPERLWDTASEGQHLNRAMQRLSKALGKSLRGKWIAKAEFQNGGWLHFHVILLGVGFVPFEVLKESWGHGGVYVSPGRGKRLRYMTKYATKEGGAGYPDWLYDREPKSVKIYRTSPGFWKELDDYEASKDPQEYSLSSELPVFTPEVRKRCVYRAKADAALDEAYGCYESIRQRIERAGRTVKVSIDGHTSEVEVDEYALRRGLRRVCGGNEYRELGWYRYEGNKYDFDLAVGIAKQSQKEAVPLARPTGRSQRHRPFTCLTSQKLTAETPRSILDYLWSNWESTTLFDESSHVTVKGVA